MNLTQASSPHNHTRLRTETAPGWVAEPEQRGNWKILYSCTFTLALCVWTAIHLNVPAPGESNFRQFLRKGKWVILAVFAPELAVFTARQQFFLARQICHQLNVAFDESIVNENDQHSDGDDPSIDLNHEAKVKHIKKIFAAIFHKSAPTIKGRQQFSLTYGFYLVMGGFVVDVSDMHDKLSKVTLAPAGLLEVARCVRFERVSDDEIRDRSKADWFAKGLVLVQVMWLILQCISRRAAGYPLSLLEFHTLVHAACALFMYFVWFKKPLDIRQPTMVEAIGMEEPLALMLLRSPNLGRVQYGDIQIPEGYTGVMEKPTLWKQAPGRSAEGSYLVYRREFSREEYGQHSTMKHFNHVDALSVTESNEQNSDSDAASSRGRGCPIEWRAPASVDLACTLTSGQFLACGVGPDGFL